MDPPDILPSPVLRRLAMAGVAGRPQRLLRPPATAAATRLRRLLVVLVASLVDLEFRNDWDTGTLLGPIFLYIYIMNYIIDTYLAILDGDRWPENLEQPTS